MSVRPFVRPSANGQPRAHPSIEVYYSQIAGGRVFIFDLHIFQTLCTGIVEAFEPGHAKRVLITLDEQRRLRFAYASEQFCKSIRCSLT